MTSKTEAYARAKAAPCVPVAYDDAGEARWVTYWPAEPAEDFIGFGDLTITIPASRAYFYDRRDSDGAGHRIYEESDAAAR